MATLNITGGISPSQELRIAIIAASVASGVPASTARDIADHVAHANLLKTVPVKTVPVAA